MPRIRELTFFPFDVGLNEPFGIATGAQLVARNVIVRLTLDDGSVGLGEAAPFPAVNGETQALVLEALPAARTVLLGLRAERYRAVSDALREPLAAVPSARCAIETALFDALCRGARRSLWAFFGGAQAQLTTDITIPTGSAEAARAAAERAWRSGFRTLKVKVGGASTDLDALRLQQILAGAPDAELVLDANASLDEREALALLDALGSQRARVVLFEQPTRAEDWDGLAAVRRQGRVRVAADESARAIADVAGLAARSAVDVINIKIMKCGLVQAWDMSVTARALGLGLMIGGMVETELAMTTSACLSGGVGGFEFVDLDTPLFMAERPLSGGFQQDGPKLSLDAIEHGHGVAFLGE